MQSNDQVILQLCIDSFKDEYLEEGVADSKVFELFCLSQIFKGKRLEYSEIEQGIIDGNMDGGFDGVYVLLNDEVISTLEDATDLQVAKRGQRIELFMVQAKISPSFAEHALDKMIVSVEKAFDLNATSDELEKYFNEELMDKILAFRHLWKASAPHSPEISVNYIYASKGVSSNITLTFIEKRNFLLEKTKSLVDKVTTQFSPLGAKELLDLYNRSLPTTLSLSMKENSVSISYQSPNKIGYAGFSTLSNYNNFISDEGSIREYIFEDNVRDFQGDVDVNAKIEETLDNDLDSDFWWFNNGVTIIASGATTTGKIIHLENPQVVNGLQTSYKIHAHIKNSSIEDDERCVLVRIVVSNDKKTIDKVISATNSQTNVPPAVFRATDEIQRKIEIFFSQYGYYYDRRKNHYKNLGKPPNKIFSIQAVAQKYFAICQYDPSVARARPASLTKDNKRYNSIFKESIPYGAYLNSSLIRQKVDSYFRKTLFSPEERSRFANFKLHVARIVPSIWFMKPRPSAVEISEMNVGELTDEFIKSSVEKLDQMLTAYTSQNEQENIINVAKSSNFSDYITSELTAELTEIEQTNRQ